MTWTIKTLEEANDLARSLSKHTECCVTVREQEVPIGNTPKPSTWWLTYKRTIGDRGRLVRVRQAGQTVQHWPNVPPWLRLWANVDEQGYYIPDEENSTGWDDLTRIVKPPWDDRQIEAVHQKSHAIQLRVRIAAEQRTRSRLGFLVFCEVGESGSGPSDFIPLPCTYKQLEKAVDDATSYAHDLEYETGWRTDEEEQA